MTAAKMLRCLSACSEAVAWAQAHGGTLAELWAACPRGDWLLWYAARAGVPREALARAAAGCAELTLPCAGPTRGACEAAIAAARAWADAPGPETAIAAANAVLAADAAANAVLAADAAAIAAARAGAYAAASAAHAAMGAARTAAYASYAAASAAYTAADAADAARAEMHAACAAVVRACVPFVEVLS